MLKILIIVLLGALTGCATSPLVPTHSGAAVSVYEEIGGASKVAEIVDNFITEIEYSPEIFPYFQHSDVSRFREKLIEHLCMLTGGPCAYTGDTMAQVHGGMGITEHDFNVGVDLFINAMTQANLEHRLQNKVIATMLETRRDIIYK